jgi:hypothetical protein
MTYTKPALLICSALKAVMGNGKHDDLLDNVQQMPSTPSAYEADE